ncbi:hypothetical protein AMJ44_03275 [candidate division WOR-1 bacterium DG_54_3]|uniref:Lipoprotein n=1 Tax=candidate division WOR-1 bacterium DG_54_3 TaxID=1703775 RepID=A0A0S7Y4G1_UNCSA|nr:MAG: hypothetical protein AMJ44_03275 [candidate division WOR-1 bacterium DG_54_3]
MSNNLKKIIIVSSVFLLISSVLLLSCFNRTNYFLNKTIRLVSLRLIQFERLSIVRKEDYKFNFYEDHYDISFFNNRTKNWRLFASHTYPNDITPSIGDLEIILKNGRISHFEIEGEEKKLKSFLILNFFAHKISSKSKGIIFYKDGNWRAFGL